MASVRRAAPGHWRDRKLDRRGVAWRLFATCWLVFALHFATNTVREIFPALSLGDRLSFDVSEYLGLHPDLFTLPGRGAFINNNPGASMLGAMPYFVARPLIDPIVARVQEQRSGAPDPPEYDTIYPLAREFVREARARGLDVKFGLGAAVMQVGLMAPLSALSVAIMYRLLLPLTGASGPAVLLALLYAFATPVLYRTAQLNQNVLVGHCALFAFALLWQPGDAASRPRGVHYLAAGLLAGWAVVLDFSGIVVALVLGGYAVARWLMLPPDARSRSDLPLFGLGLAASLAVLAAYQWQAFGHPLFPAQAYMPAANYTDQGYRGLSWPQADLLLETAVGLRYGLFTSAPLLLLALWPPAWRQAGGRLVGLREFWCILAFCGLFFLFAAANQYGRMQFNSGVRHVVPATPFLFFLSAGTLLWLPRLAAVLIGIGCTYWSWCLAMYRDVEQGVGIFESIVAISTHGPRLPWLTTLERLGYIHDGSPVLALVMLSAGLLILALWGGTRPWRAVAGLGPRRADRLSTRVANSLPVDLTRDKETTA
jgi:hypothetical protein